MTSERLGGRQWCERAVPRFLPALRAHITASLTRDHGMSQREIAERLGLTQAAVSHYLRRRRGQRRQEAAFLRNLGERLANRVAAGLSGPRLTAAICGACTSYRRTQGVGPCHCVLGGVSKPDFLAALEGEGFPHQPCENVVVGRLLPFLRSELAHRLADRRGQTEVGTLLGVSQPAVSRYLTGDRGQDRQLASHPATEGVLEELAEGLQEARTDGQRKEALCRACVRVRRTVFGPGGDRVPGAEEGASTGPSRPGTANP